MVNKMKQFTLRFFCTILVLAMVFSSIPMDTNAEADDPFVVVSLGDSYSAGEGIPDFYGPTKELLESEESFWNRRIASNDFMAHRSPNSWPAQLKFSEVSGLIRDYKVTDGEIGTGDVQWYFVAVSGAVSSEIHEVSQKRKYKQTVHDLSGDRGDKKIIQGKKSLPIQTAVFDRIGGEKVDYVTMTIGGNDLGFSAIVEKAARKSTYLGNTELEEMLAERWNKIETYLDDLKDTYKAVASKAPNAEIIIAGYPKLFEQSGRGWLISEKEATSINSKITMYNNRVAALIDSLDEQYNLHYVPVETRFNGHEAYSSDAWLNKIYISAKGDDLDEDAASSHSMHPNATGAEEYARLVNAKIAEIESRGTLDGKIMKASDRATPVENATINIARDGSTTTLQSDSDGHYSKDLIAGDYYVNVVADGYIEFNAFTTVDPRRTTYMETFLMVEGEEGQIGEAIGKITNALTGTGVEGVQLDVRSGWNNCNSGDILTTVTTNASGDYTVTLPIGNYTLSASKNGFVSSMINIVVQPNVCTSKNGSMTPIVSGDNFRIVLTWGENPADLDSHVVGSLSSGNSFHVYYADMYADDNDGTAVCKLDVDDTTSFGPETITLQTVTDNPYYYYIHHYSGSGSISTSEAQIKVYQGENLIATFNAPTNLGTAIYWNVFAIVDGELVIRNTITSSPDTSYAGASTFSLMTAELETDTVNSPKKTLDTVEEATVAAEEQEITPEETAATIVEEVLIEKMVTEEPTEAAEESVSEASEEAEADPAVEEIDAEEVIEPEA